MSGGGRKSALWGRPAALLLALAFLWGAPASAQQIGAATGGGLGDLLGTDGSISARTIQLFFLVTVLSLAPALAIMVTCFPFIVTVLSILRQAIGLQQSPPNMLIVSLALFLTYFVMDPVLRAAWDAGIDPMIEGTMTPETAIPAALEPFRGFMANRVAADTFASLLDLRAQTSGTEPVVDATADAPLSILIPAFMLSEIERAFEIGFLIFLPFLVIDLVVAAILMSMGMMMVPPVVVSLPFKLAFFVVADGWTLVSGALVRSYF